MTASVRIRTSNHLIHQPGKIGYSLIVNVRFIFKNNNKKKQTLSNCCNFCVTHCRRYRDKERAEPAAPSSTTPRATTPSERSKPTINVTVNPKSLSGGQSASAKSAMKPTKKIDMGAASTFGRDELGINSPTHRNTHAEEDLFGAVNVVTANANKADLLDDLFKTCATPANASVIETTADDDFFNPRADETNEFGDFASAFGGSAAVTTAAAPAPASLPVIASLSLDSASESKNCDFADFSAFDGSSQQSSISNVPQDSANLLFSMNASNSNAQTTTSNSSQPIGDLLSDLDGLSLSVPVASGECFVSLSNFSMVWLVVDISNRFECLCVYVRFFVCIFFLLRSSLWFRQFFFWFLVGNVFFFLCVCI